MEYLHDFVREFPNVNRESALRILEQSSAWYELATEAIDYLKEYPKDKHLKNFLSEVFEALNDNHLKARATDETFVSYLETQALSLLGLPYSNLNIPRLVNDMVFRAIGERTSLAFDLERLLACLLDLDFGRFDSDLYVATRSVATDVYCGVASSEILREFALVMFDDIYQRALKRFTKETGVEVPDSAFRCPYLAEDILDEVRFLDKYGLKLHEASLNEPPDVVFRSWKV